jgi:hypothetical protein
MNPVSLLPPPVRAPIDAPNAVELTPKELFDLAAGVTGSYYTGEPLLESASPEEVVMGVIANFSGDPNITAYERGVLMHMVIEMKADGGISMDEARSFANRVEGMTRGLENFEPH